MHVLEHAHAHSRAQAAAIGERKEVGTQQMSELLKLLKLWLDRSDERELLDVFAAVKERTARSRTAMQVPTLQLCRHGCAEITMCRHCFV